MKPAADGQLIVALAIVAAMLLIAVGLMVTAYLLSNWGVASLAVGTIIGALATALNAPTGIANALRANNSDPQ
jgi:hypothetical protein